MPKTFVYLAIVWKYQGKGGWYFVTVDAATARQIKASLSGRPTGWGQIPVLITIGGTTWKTSLFPSKGGEMLFAIKAEVRKNEGINEGTGVRATIVLR